MNNNKPYCKCNTCTTFNCDDCTICDSCFIETGCKDINNNENIENEFSQICYEDMSFNPIP
jgi:hypothetical protein